MVDRREGTGTVTTMFTPVLGSAEHVADQRTVAMHSIHTTHLALGVLPGMDPAHTAASLHRLVNKVRPAVQRQGSQP